MRYAAQIGYAKAWYIEQEVDRLFLIINVNVYVPEINAKARIPCRRELHEIMRLWH